MSADAFSSIDFNGIAMGQEDAYQLIQIIAAGKGKAQEKKTGSALPWGVVRTPMVAIIIIFVVVGCIAWVVWTPRKSKQALDKDALDQAWREVLDDPHYMSGDAMKSACV